MSTFWAALWAEQLKARRSKISLGISLSFLILPFIGGLFMVILKNPDQARRLGIISVKAQLTGGTADWPTFFDLLLQGSAIGGAIIFAFITAWVFGREFSDHTIKELLAVPTPREAIVTAKLVLIAGWTQGLSLLVYLVGLGIGFWVDIPGWSSGLAWSSMATMLFVGLLNLMLLPLVALFASTGRGYIPSLGWAVTTIALAQIAAVMGWGDWFPWSVPALVSGMAGPSEQRVALHSCLVVLLTSIAGTAAVFTWWRSADQAR